MKILHSFMVVLILRQTIAGVTRKSPAFSTPVYSNSYLPAAMQVIFHAVEQLKNFYTEEISQEQSSNKTTATATTTTMSRTTQPMSHQSTTTAAISYATPKVQEETTEALELSASSTSEKLPDIVTEAAQQMETLATSVHQEEASEVNAETTETNYATPETNHETQEPNQELPEKSEEEVFSKHSSTTEILVEETSRYSGTSSVTSSVTPNGQLSVDSIVDEIYEIVKTTASSFDEDIKDPYNESKSAVTSKSEEEEEETRFTLLGERVTQVPRPSLNSYLKRNKVPPKPALQQLANLYDALSKDARKQGFARFAGYSDEVLKDLQSTAEGGVGPQLKKLLEKVIKRNELTRDDAKMKTSQALRDLDDPASALSKDLRRLLPLRYTV